MSHFRNAFLASIAALSLVRNMWAEFSQRLRTTLGGWKFAFQLFEYKPHSYLSCNFNGFDASGRPCQASTHDMSLKEGGVIFTALISLHQGALDA